MDRVSEARQAIATALQPALPGRVQPYRPAHLAAGVAPAIWIAEHNSQWRRVGREPVSILHVLFPVWLVVNGAEHAGQALYDELCAAAFDCATAAALEVDGWNPATFPADADVDPRLRAAVMTVAQPIYASTLCQVSPSTALVPPELVEV